jgi:hypothetical protein
MGVTWAVEQDMFFSVPIELVWVGGVKLGMVGVGTRAQSRVIRSLSEAVRVVGVERVVCRPLEDGGRDETALAFCCGLDGGRGNIIRGGVAGDVGRAGVWLVVSMKFAPHGGFQLGCVRVQGKGCVLL